MNTGATSELMMMYTHYTYRCTYLTVFERSVLDQKKKIEYVLVQLAKIPPSKKKYPRML